MLGVLADAWKRHLVGAEGPLDRDAVDLLRTGPPLRGPHHDRRPARPLRRAAVTRPLFDRADLRMALGQRRGEVAVNLAGFGPRDNPRLVAVGGEQADDIGLRSPAEDGR